MTARVIVAIHLGVFVPLVAVCWVFAGIDALYGGGLAFTEVLGLNLLMWRISRG